MPGLPIHPRHSDSRAMTATDFKTVIQRGAVALQAPVDKEWCVRTAYFKGPGVIKCEIEGPIQ